MKIQKTKLGYNFSAIKRKMQLVKTMGGDYINIVHLGRGTTLITFRVKFITSELLELNNVFGTRPVYIKK